jgi:replicative DNA helicase
VTIRGYVDEDEALSAAGGITYIAGLCAASVHVLDATEFGRQILDLYQRRRVIEIGTAAANSAHELEASGAAGLIEGLERSLSDLGSIGGGRSEAKTFNEVVTEALISAEASYARGAAVGGLSSGFRGLDGLLGGLHKSDLLILAGRPSMGKTALAANIAFNVARAYREEHTAGRNVVVAGARVGFFSLEMSAEQLGARILAEQAGLASNRVRQGHLSSIEMDRYLATGEARKHTPLIIDDTPALTITALRSRARRMKRRHGLGLLVVDYLQMLEAPNGRDGRVQEVSAITRGLKALAKELEVPVLALSQLSRNVEARTDKRPQLADLRESGSIEQDADVVMFVYREEYYLERSDKKNSHEHISSMGGAEIIVAKQRNGPTGSLPMRFDGALTKFSDVDIDGIRA